MEKIRKRFPNALKNLEYLSKRVVLNNSDIFYRLMIGSFENKISAKEFCFKINLNKICIIKKINNE